MRHLLFSPATHPAANAPPQQMRKVAGMLLYCLQQTARRISTDQDSRHRKRILEDEEFYARWLYPRIERFYRKMGWPIDIGLVREGHSACQEDHPLDRYGSKTTVASGACCTPKGRRGSSIKVAFGRLLKRKRAARKPTENAQPQVGEVCKIRESFGMLPCLNAAAINNPLNRPPIATPLNVSTSFAKYLLRWSSI